MTKVTLGDVAIERKQTYKGNKDNIPNVGLEHLIPSEVKLTRWDMNVDNTFTKGFTKGQILLGRRRAYLKKAVVAPFDGICSGDITVIEAIPNKICVDLLPFIIQNDRFFDYATRGSAGSLSPRVKWEYLKDYELNLPPIEEQEHLTKLLWAAYELKESYKKLITAMDEMVKAQFIEIMNNCNYEQLKLSDVADISTGSTPSRNHSEYWGNSFFWVSAQDMENKYIYDTKEKLTEKGARKCKILPKGSILYVCRGSIGVISINMIECATNQSICAATCKENCINEYLYSYLKYNESKIKSLGSGTSFNSINQTTFSNIKIKLPSIDTQKEFIKIVFQADKSKAELQQSIDNIDKMMKSLLP